MTGIVSTVVLTVFIVIFNGSFVNQDYSKKWFLLSVATFSPIIIGLVMAFKINIKSEKLRKFFFVVLFLLMPIITMTMSECLNSIWVYDMTYLGFLANYTVILLLYFFVFAISGSLKISILSITPVIYGFALAHSYISAFRGTPFIPMDFLSITTAINVGNTYDYTPTDIIILATLMFILIMTIGVKVSTPKFKLLTRLISRIFTGVFFSVVIFTFYFTPIFTNAGIQPDFWNQSRGYRNYGFVYNFICNTKYLYMSVPNGYNSNDVGNYVSKEVEKEKPSSDEKKPNIICIMNESLSDLKVLGDFKTNKDYMPFIRSLKKNTVKGNLYVPVIGAGTSNTEFEFLTGHSTSFLPPGSNAYMLYIKNPIASMTSTLISQGYSSMAFHPYYESGWNRVSVYKFMGFDSFKSLEDLIDISIMDDYMNNSSDPDYLQYLINKNYPSQKKMLIRQYISDSYNYKVLIDDFENRDKSKPFFCFNVTMQNHGGYTTTASNFSPNIKITSTKNEYVKTTNYLSLIKKSDLAFKELINYFKKVDEPTVICMFGDHQPSIETKFISEVIGVDDLSKLTIEQDQNRHVTPFIIWANYDIKEKNIDKLSVNYLSSYVLDIAGVKLTKYNKYLINLSKTIPVIDTVGYIDKDNNYYKWSESSKYTELLQDYEKIQYNNIFDYENNNANTFFVNGYSVEKLADIVAQIEEKEALQNETTEETK
ncbi:MAG: sulfatase-like hydrolase/transferase [Clostridia bacterium]|nr:sulfatase-like hydrolase/transferase [Clostridia bacterium]